MKGIETLKRISKYYNDPRPDLVPAFKLMLRPEFKMPVWDFIKYFATFFASKIPLAKNLIGKKRTVDFSTYMRAYDNTTATLAPYRKLLSRVVELAQISQGQRVVDLGAGTGNLSIELAAAGANVLSVDSSQEVNVIHRAKNPQASIESVNIDRNDKRTGFINLPDRSVDKVCAANLWTYINNRDTLYAEIRRLLKPGGLLVLAVEKRGYSPLSILKDHLSREYHRYLEAGDLPLTAVVKVYTDFISKYEDLLITAEETKKLLRGIAAGQYKVYDQGEIAQELKRNGFTVISSELSYAGQAIIITADPAI